MKLTLITFAASISAIALAQTPTYSAQSLRAVNGESEAFAINDSGVAVGWSFLLNGTRGAVAWRPGRVEILRSVGGTSIAHGINDQGVIVGKAGTKGVRFLGQNVVSDFGTFGGNEGIAYSTNERGDVAGSSQNRNADWRAYGSRWDRNLGLQFLGTLGGLWSAAKDINEVGAFAGWSHTRSGPTHASIFVRGRAPVDLGTLGGPQSEANAINDYFAVVGWSDLATRHNTPTNRGNVRRAFKWSPETNRMVNLGEPFSVGKTRKRDTSGRYYFDIVLREGEFRRAYRVYGVDTFGTDVDRYGNVTGYARLYTNIGGFRDRAMVWINGTGYDLNDLIGGAGVEWTLTHAWGTNGMGQIVGGGTNHRVGDDLGFLLNRTR